MSISDVVLFYSKFSTECKDCVIFVQQTKLPVALIALDTKESRDHALNGSLIQIKNVPSMIVSYEDGNVQLYVGKPKIMGWFTAITQHPVQKPNIPEPTQTTKIEKKEQVAKRIKTKKPIKKQKKPKKHSDDDDGGVELIFEEESRSPNNTSSKLSTKPSNVSPNAGVMSMANQLMAERNRQLNIKDGDS